MNLNNRKSLVVSLSTFFFVFLFAIFGQTLLGDFAVKAGVTKGYVCKYVGTPGVNETLQTGNNPIEVAMSAISGWDGVTIPYEFNDQHGKSVVIGVVPLDPEPTIDDCPAPIQCVEEVTCPDECRVETVSLEGICGEVVCEGNAPQAEVCPTECDYPGGTVLDGECGYIDCPAIGECVDPTPPPDPSEEPTPSPAPSPEVSPSPSSSSSPSVSPTPTPTPAPSPSPSIGGVSDKSVLGINISCNPSFEVTLDLFKDGNPVEGVEVSFSYNSTQVSKTNADGRASTYFDKTEDGPVHAVIDGYPDQSIYVTMPECDEESEEGEVLGTTTESYDTTTYYGGEGQVLGATILADTGQASDMLPILVIVLGALMTVTSGYAYLKVK